MLSLAARICLAALAAPTTAPQASQPAACDLEAAWSDLGLADEAAAHDAVVRLARTGAPAGRFLAGRVQPIRAADADRLRRLIAQLDEAGHEARQRAEAELAAAGEAALPLLRAALSERPSQEQRERIAQLLDPPADAPARRQAARTASAILALEIIGDTQARGVLASLAGGQPGAPTTRRARDALARLDARKGPIAPEVRVAMEELAGDDAAAHLRAVRRMESSGPAELAPAAAALVGVLRGKWYPQQPEGVEAGERAVALLGRIGEPAADPLIAALKSQDTATRAGAAMALGAVRSSRAARPLVEALADADGLVRMEAVKSLAACDRRLVTGLLIEAVKADNWGAAQALSTFGDPQAVPCLLKALDSRTPAMRCAAALALGAHKAAQAVRPLIALAARQSEDVAVRQRAISALGQIGDPEAVEPLIAVLRTAKVSEVLVPALAALRDLRDRRAVDAVIGALRDPEPNVRSHAATGLGRLGGPKALQPLLLALRDVQPDVRSAAAYGLADLGDRSATPGLIALLEMGHPTVRNSAVIALGRLRDPRAVEPIIRAWSGAVLYYRQPGEEEQANRIHAEALRALTGQDIGPDREAWERWRLSRHGGQTQPASRP